MTPLFKKLNFKAQNAILVLQAPESFAAELQQMAAATEVHTDVANLSACSFIMVFVTRQAEIDALTPLVTAKLEEDGVLWFCYPKGSSKKYRCDFNRDTGWDVLGAAGFEGVRMVAIDADWSALRFRKAEHIKTMSRSFAKSEVGKQKVLAGKQ